MNNGANSIWEHQLLDPSTLQRSMVKRKPAPTDPQYPNKDNFVKAKYQDLLFAIRPSAGSTVEDLSQQLYSSVRTNIVETSLRLLAMGADANYRHPERGNQAIHVAAAAGQPLQVELLVIYGADPMAIDSEGRTPAECAKSEGFDELAARLAELTYELTDRLIMYLCGRRPDHRSKMNEPRSQHIVVPEMAIGCPNDSIQLGRSRLMSLSDKLVADLAQDCYDEVDRRELEALWHQVPSSCRIISNQGLVPFLPPNTNLSAARNQSRQKLGLLSEKDFRTLLIELLREIKRRVRITENGGHPLADEVIEMMVERAKSPKSQPQSPLSVRKEIINVHPVTNGKDNSNLSEILERLDFISKRLDRIEKHIGLDALDKNGPMSPSTQKKQMLNGTSHQSSGNVQNQVFSRTSEVTRIVADLCSTVSSAKHGKRGEINGSDPTLATAASLWTAVCGLCDLFEQNCSVQDGDDDEKSLQLQRSLADLRESASAVLTEARSFALSEDVDAPSEQLSRACYSVAQATRFVLASSRQVFSQ